MNVNPLPSHRISAEGGGFFFARTRGLGRLLGCLLMLASMAGVPGQSAPPGPVLVFLLAGQSNMEGQAVVDLEGPDYNGGRGTLKWVLQNPSVAAEFPGWRNPDGAWNGRDDVWVRFQREDGSLKKGPLTVGFTGYEGRHHFGPELQFGRVVGEALAPPVLLIKTAWGGKSLYADFRPPSSGGTVGPYYQRMLAEVRTALSRLTNDFPEFQGRGHELRGMVWYQGWNDGCDPQRAVPEYATNLVHLIRDVRRDLGVPGLPVVVGELTGPWVTAPNEWAELRRAQAAAAQQPEFAGNVAFVSTREAVRRPEDSPNPGHGHHEFGNAETYLRVGDALGRAMVTLLNAGVRDGYRVFWLEGWQVRVRPELWEQQRDATVEALQLLQAQLAEIVRVVPAPAVRRLREVTLWVSPEYPGISPRAEYHPEVGWLRANRRNPEMAKGVEFTNVRIFAAETRRMPNFALHELAHAYHDRVLGFDQPDILAAYEAARKAGGYEQVERTRGDGRPSTRERAYALTDAKEYFAEGTESFFVRNDFYPFQRAELHQFDPQLEEVLERMWSRLE